MLSTHSLAQPPLQKVPTVSFEGHSYQARVEETETDLQVWIDCRRSGTKLEAWRTPLYSITFRAGVDRAIQRVYPKHLEVLKDQVVLTDDLGRTYTVDARSGLTPKAFLISGFDDVLRQAENTGLLKAGLKLFEPDRSFAGMRELYTLLTNTEDTPRFILVSAIATWFERRITDFLNETRYPSVELRLRNWLTQWSIESFKMEQISSIIKTRPDQRFIVIFDNSDASLQMTERLLAEYPNKITHVYLREVEQKEHPAGSIPFVTAFDIAVSEVRLRRLSEKEAVVVGHALLDEKDAQVIIPDYAHCPVEYNPCPDVTGDLVKICGLIQERVRAICAGRN